MTVGLRTARRAVACVYGGVECPEPLHGERDTLLRAQGHAAVGQECFGKVMDLGNCVNGTGDAGTD